jgi:mannose-6-phosphate isomerase-like protein (cupin superfamily)
MAAFDVDAARDRLRAQGGGYEIVHASPGMEVGVYVPPFPDPQQPHTADEVYVVLDGECTLQVADESLQLGPGDGAFVGAGVEHRFTTFEPLRLVLLVVFQR